MRYRDVSVTLSESTPVWPGDEPFRRLETSSLGQGNGCNVSALSMSAHAGTHVDASFHFIQDGSKVDEIPLDTLVGPAWVCVVPDSVRAVTADVLEAAGIPSDTRRLLLATSNTALWADPGGHMSEAYVYLSEDAAGWLVRRGVLLVGIDYLSVDPFTSPDHPAHSLLLSAGIVIVEAVDLRGVPSGPCGLWCLPLRIAGGDGAPARVILGWDDQ